MKQNQKSLCSFDNELTTGIEDIEFNFRGIREIPWLEFLLNPRRLRGSDFLMRWSQGVWSEKRITDGINKTTEFFALPYGTSSTAPENDVRKYELYFELLDEVGHGDIKRPDLLIFNVNDKPYIQSKIDSIDQKYKIPFVINSGSDHQEYLRREEIFPFIHEDDEDVRAILSKAIIAVECENSLWKASQMPDYGAIMRPQRRLGGRLGFKKSAVMPTVIIKDEDMQPLISWQDSTGVPIHIWHVFFDLAYGLALDEARRLVREGLIEAKSQTFQAPNGIITSKNIYKYYYCYAYNLGYAESDPTLSARFIVDKNGHILPYVSFEGGSLVIHEDALHILQEIQNSN